MDTPHEKLPLVGNFHFQPDLVQLGDGGVTEEQTEDL
jgi:hypothetical protein